MYEGHFKLRGRPFLAAPDPARYFPAAAIELARQTLVRTIERGEGPGLLIGAPGTGKSLLCQLIAQRFAEKYAVALLVHGRFGTRMALLQAILHELRIPYRGLEEGELRLALLDCLDPANCDHHGLLLIVDEAHLLPWRVLEEIRLLTNLVRNSLPRVRVMLAGNAVLEERFASPKLSSFNQRMAARCYLASMDAAETAAYVREQIGCAGGDADALFDEDCLRAVHRTSDGVPRLVSQICDHAMVLACVAGVERLNAAAIEEAWADLQQLPAPWTANREAAPSEQVIEFGDLDEAADERPTAIPFPTAGSRQQAMATDSGECAAVEPTDSDSDIEESFQPAGSIGGQIDLDFGTFGDPFSEQFEQEEVVLDRYGSQIDLFRTRTRTACGEGMEIGAMLDTWATSHGCVAPGSVRLGQLAVPQALADERGSPNDRPAVVAADQQAISQDYDFDDAPTIEAGQPPIAHEETQAAAPGAAGGASDRASWRQSFSQGQLKQVSLARGAARLLSDGPIVVVESETPKSIIVDRAPSAHAPLRRKREYRQLFAKLRRE